MAIQVKESVAKRGITYLGTKWSVTGSPTIDATGSSRGGPALVIASTNRNIGIGLTAQQTLIVHLRVKITNFGGGGGALFFLMDGGTVQVTIAPNAVGQLTAYRGNSYTGEGTLLGTSGQALLLNNWYSIEVKAKIAQTTGAIEIRVAGGATPWLSLSSQDTAVTANESANYIKIGSRDNYTYTYFYCHDIVIRDDTGGAPNNDFCGDQRVDGYLGNGAGTTTEWTPLASTNISQVDEDPPDGDTTYNYDTTVGHIDTFTHEAMTHNPLTIYGAGIDIVARKDDSGSREIDGVFYSGTTNYACGVNKALTTNYLTHCAAIQEVDPDTAAAWTQSGFNAAEIGYKLTV